MNNPTPDIIERHKRLVLLLIQLNDAHSDRAHEVRAMVRQWNNAFPILEQTYIKMMSDNILQED